MFAEIIGGVHVLCFDGLVDKDLECGKVMKIELTTESSVEATTEPLLFLGVGGDFFGSITSQPVELTTKLINGPSALSEVAELLTLAVHKTLGNVVLAEGRAEFLPRCRRSNGTHIQKVLPPRASCTFEVIGGIADLVTSCHTACLELPLDAAKPVIGVKGLGGVTKNRGMKSDEVVPGHQLISLLSGVASNDFQQVVRVSAVPLDFHQNLCHRGWGWKVAFLLIIPTTLVTTNLATGSLRHPEGEKPKSNRVDWKSQIKVLKYWKDYRAKEVIILTTW